MMTVFLDPSHENADVLSIDSVIDLQCDMTCEGSRCPCSASSWARSSKLLLVGIFAQSRLGEDQCPIGKLVLTWLWEAPSMVV